VIKTKVFVAVGVGNVLVEVRKLGRGELMILRSGDMVLWFLVNIEVSS
jgi:hypothetical protein